jgi:hypothetical protein
MPDDFEALVAKTRIEPNTAERKSLRHVVGLIIQDTDTLKNIVNQTFGDYGTIKGVLISNLQHIKDYQDGFKEIDGWYWRLNTWNLANDKLNECKTKFENIIADQDEADKSGRQVLALTKIITQCDTCLEHMQDYKEICEKIPLSIDLNPLERTMRRVGLKSQLQALKALHDT